MVEKRFRMLRSIATLCKFLGGLMLVLGIVGALLGGVLITVANTDTNLLTSYFCWYPTCTDMPDVLANVLVISVIFLLCVILCFVFLGTGEVLSLGIAIEENTRRTAFIMRMWLTPQQPGGGNTPGQGTN